jgi:type IV secretory pathway TraG/TraD family ATPase VirD4
MYALTSGVRAGRGPVHVFNPQGLGGIPSTFRWSPIDGCTDASTAIRRGNAFAQAIGTEGTEDGSFWSTTAGGCLRAMFAAAALAQADMRLVTQWIRAQRTEDALHILDAASRPDEAGALEILVSRAGKTADTVRAVLSQAVAYMADPVLAASTLPGPGGGIDIDEFLLSGGTLYMIAKGQDGDSVLAPLFAALASEIHWRATQLASRLPGGRLDPPLLLALDEVTNICPVPLPYWLADSGGQGVSVWTAFHGRAQLVSRWKEAGAQTVMDTTNVRILMPGLADADVLDQASRLAGQAAYREHGHEGWSRHPVLSPDMIRMIPAGWALAQRGPHSPVILHVAKGWRDRAYRKAVRHGTAIAPLTAAAAVPALGPAAATAALGVVEPRELADVTSRQTDFGPVEYADLIGAGPEAGAGASAASYPWSGGDAA